MARSYTSLWFSPTRRYDSVLTHCGLLLALTNYILALASITVWCSRAVLLFGFCRILALLTAFVPVGVWGSNELWLGPFEILSASHLLWFGLHMAWSKELVFRHYIFGSRRLNGLVPSYYSMVLVHFGLVIMK